MKNILITGGKGFIGRNLQEGLAGKYTIYAPGHQELDALDFCSLQRFVTEYRIDVIIHAAIHVPMFNGPEHEMFNDMTMFWNLEKVSDQVEKIIYFGSGAEFDKRYDIRDAKEEDLGRTIPANEYGLAKYTMTKAARASRNIYNLRLFGIFGKYELWDIKFLSNLCCKALYGLPLTIRKDCAFNFIAVDDLIPVIEWMIHNEPRYHDYNFCHNESYMLSELAQMIREISGKDLEIRLLSDERNLDYTGSNRRLRTEARGWAPTPIREAVTELYAYYAGIRDQIDYDKLKGTK